MNRYCHTCGAIAERMDKDGYWWCRDHAPFGPVCKTAGCTRWAGTLGYCDKHWPWGITADKAKIEADLDRIMNEHH